MNPPAALGQWAVNLDPHNATALARLSYTIVTSLLNHWSADTVADLHTADLALQDAIRISPGSLIVHGVQCNILRLHNESGYNKADAWLAR